MTTPIQKPTYKALDFFKDEPTCKSYFSAKPLERYPMLPTLR